MRIKSYIIFLGLIIVVVVITPAINGFCFRHSYLKFIDNVNTTSVNKINMVAYHEGWWSSDAVLTTNDGAVTFNQHIMHGPYVKNPATDKGTFAKAIILTQMHGDKKLETMLMGARTDGLMQITTQVSYADDYASYLKIPVINVTVPDKTKISWQGLNGTLDMKLAHHELKYLSSEMTFGALSAIFEVAPLNSLSISSGTQTAQRTCQETIFCSGTSDLSVPLINMSISGGPVQIAGFNAAMTYGVKDTNSYSVDLKWILNKLDTTNYSVNPFNMEFSVNNVNADELKKFLEMVQNNASASSKDTQLKAMTLVFTLPHLIMQATQVNLVGAGKTPYGNFTWNAKWFWPMGTPLPISTTDLNKGNFQLDIRAATALVDHVITTLDQQQELFSQSQPDTTTPPPAAPADLQELNKWVSSNKITSDTRTKLLTLEQQNLAPTIYNVGVDNIVKSKKLPIELAAQLKTQYLATHTEDGALLQKPIAAEVVTGPGPVRVGADKNKQQFDSLIKQGYVVQNKDDYVVSIVYQNGVMKVNGVTMPTGRSKVAIK